MNIVIRPKDVLEALEYSFLIDRYGFFEIMNKKEVIVHVEKVIGGKSKANSFCVYFIDTNGLVSFVFISPDDNSISSIKKISSDYIFELCPRSILRSLLLFCVTPKLIFLTLLSIWLFPSGKLLVPYIFVAVLFPFMHFVIVRKKLRFTILRKLLIFELLLLVVTSLILLFVFGF